MTKQRWLLIAFCLFIVWLVACGPAPHSAAHHDDFYSQHQKTMFDALHQKAVTLDSINCRKNLGKEQRRQALLELYQHSAVVRFAKINQYGNIIVWFEEPYYKKLGDFIDVPDCNVYEPPPDSLPPNK